MFQDSLVRWYVLSKQPAKSTSSAGASRVGSAHYSVYWQGNTVHDKSGRFVDITETSDSQFKIIDMDATNNGTFTIAVLGDETIRYSMMATYEVMVNETDVIAQYNKRIREEELGEHEKGGRGAHGGRNGNSGLYRSLSSKETVAVLAAGVVIATSMILLIGLILVSGGGNNWLTPSCSEDPNRAEEGCQLDCSSCPALFEHSMHPAVASIEEPPTVPATYITAAAEMLPVTNFNNSNNNDSINMNVNAAGTNIATTNPMHQYSNNTQAV